jgi:hypothetical protein
MSVIWTWPLTLRFRDHIPGLPGDNFSFLWNLWWMRKAWSAPELSFFYSNYLFSPFGVDLINHPHTALHGFISATALSNLSVIEAENLYIIVSVFLNAACAYVLAFDIVGERRLALVTAFAFGGSPYVAAHLFGHFDLLAAWVIPLFALFLRKALHSGNPVTAIGCGVCVTLAAYSAYYYVVYLALFALAYTVAWWGCVKRGEKRYRDPFSPKPSEKGSRYLFSLRLIIVALLAFDVLAMLLILATGGFVFSLRGFEISARTLHNPLVVMWILVIAWLLATWRLPIRFQRPPSEMFWRGMQTLMITAAVFAVLCLPLVLHAFKLAASGRYVSQVYFWRSAPRGIDPLSTIMGNPFHPFFGGVVSDLYRSLGLNRIESVGWIGVVPMAVLLIGRGKWLDREETGRWKIVLIVFAIWALGPFLTLAGVDLGLPLPQALARFVPLVENARMPGRAMVCVYLALGVLMALRLAGLKASTTDEVADASVVPTFPPSQSFGEVSPKFARDARTAADRSAAADSLGRPAVQWALLTLLAVDYLHAPIPLTALDRPAVYEHLASIHDNGAVIEVPFGIGDGLSSGIGHQNRRILYYATIHGHPLVGGYIGRMPPGVAQAYETMPIVGNLLRLSSGGQDAIEEVGPPALPFRYVVLDSATASSDLIDYMRSSLEMDLIASGDGKELYAVQGAKPPNFRAAR